MLQPDPELSHLYGTTKEANDLSTAVRIAGAILGLGLLSHDYGHVNDKQEEQRQEHDDTRQEEAQRMLAMREALKTASATGRFLARESMKKQAMGIPMVQAAKAVLGKAGTSVAKAFTPGWKTKALGLGALGATGYGGYKAMGAVRDYANEEHGDARWGSLRPLKHNINEYGTPVS